MKESVETPQMFNLPDDKLCALLDQIMSVVAMEPRLQEPLKFKKHGHKRFENTSQAG